MCLDVTSDSAVAVPLVEWRDSAGGRIFHLQASLADIAEDVWVIRRILEGGDDEEEEEDQTEDR